MFAADLPIWFVRVLAFVFGALWGSFFNVCIYRWPREMSVVKPPSHCPGCGEPVRWYLNLPIFGYALLGGKARCCGAPLTARYVWVEAITAVLCVAVAERFILQAAPDALAWQAALEALLYFAFVGGLVIATFVDLEWMEIPDEVSLPGAALGLATVTFRGAPGAVEAALGAGLGFLIIQVPFVWLYEQLRGFRGMGEGDSKLLMFIGAFLGWRAVLFSLIAGSIQGLFVAAIGMATGSSLVPERPDDLPDGAAPEGAEPSTEPDQGDSEKGDKNTEVGADEQSEESDAPAPPMIVFGPLLAIAAIEYLFFGEELIAVYWQLLSWIGNHQ